MTIAIILVFTAMSQISKVTAEAPQLIIEDAIVDLQKEEYSDEDIITLISLYSKKYDVDEFVIKQVIWHESHYNEDAEGDFYNGRYNSFGLSQIHLPSHPNVSKQEATDPHFAIEFMAKNIKSGRGRMWTGYRLCINNETVIHQGKKLECSRLTN